jgi:hypothetical protein
MLLLKRSSPSDDDLHWVVPTEPYEARLSQIERANLRGIFYHSDLVSIDEASAGSGDMVPVDFLPRKP